jgi:hypothetical protein
MSGIDEQQRNTRVVDTRVIEIECCLSCPYCVFDNWTEEYLCQVSDMVVIGVDVETEIMDGCKLPYLKDIKSGERDE